LRTLFRQVGFNSHGKETYYTEQQDVVNGTYYQKDNSSNWTSYKLSPALMNVNAEQANPYYLLSMFRKIPGVALVGSGHYQVTCTASQIGAYLNWDYEQAAKVLTENGITTVTANFWLDSSGRPVKDTITGQSSHVRLSAAETFTEYNVPLAISAP
jgi:hypothetical protein